MKKALIVLLILSLFITTGCTKKTQSGKDNLSVLVLLPESLPEARPMK